MQQKYLCCLLISWRLCVCGVAYWRVGPRSMGRHSRPVHCRDAWQNCSRCGHSSTNTQLQVWRAARLWYVSYQNSDINLLQVLTLNFPFYSISGLAQWSLNLEIC